VAPVILHVRSGFLVGGPEKLIMSGLNRMRESEFNFILTTFVLPGRENHLVTAALKRGLDIEKIRIRNSFDPSAISSLRRIIKRRRAAIIVAHDYRAVGLTLLCTIGLCIPRIAVAHGWTSQNTKVRIYEKIERHALKLMDRVVAVSKPKYRELVNLGISETKLVDIENGVELPQTKMTGRSPILKEFLSLPEETVLIGTVGRMSKEKAQTYFLKAAARLKDKHPKARFVILGDGQMRTDLEKEARTLGIEGICLFPGWWTDMETVFRGLDLFVLPSLTEGLPMALLEAMSYGLPSVVSEVGGCPDVIDNGKNGYLVKPGDLDTLTSRIDMLLSDPESRRRVGEQARIRIAERYTMDRYAGQFLSLYRTIIKGEAER